MLQLYRLDPRHITMLEPLPIRREIRHRAGLERLEATRLVIVGEGITRLRCRDICSKTVRLQISLAPGIGDVQPEPHWTAQDTMLYVSRRKMCSERKTVGPCSDNRDRDLSHDATF